MAWREWVWGLVAALATAGATVIGTLMSLASCPTGWELTKIAVFPAALAFLSYVKDHNPKP